MRHPQDSGNSLDAVRGHGRDHQRRVAVHIAGKPRNRGGPLPHVGGGGEGRQWSLRSVGRSRRTTVTRADLDTAFGRSGRMGKLPWNSARGSLGPRRRLPRKMESVCRPRSGGAAVGGHPKAASGGEDRQRGPYGVTSTLRCAPASRQRRVMVCWRGPRGKRRGRTLSYSPLPQLPQGLAATSTEEPVAGAPLGRGTGV